MLTSLNPHDEFFLTLMRLRLRLLNEDVADRFDILPAKSSITFATWIKLLNKLLKNLVAWLRREAIPNILIMNPDLSPRLLFFKSIIYFKSLSSFTSFSRSLSFLHFFFSQFPFFHVFLCFNFYWFPNRQIF